LERYPAQCKKTVDDALARWLSEEPDVPETLRKAMCYSVLAGGKRIRPILCLTVAEGLETYGEGILRAACAFELLHTYSLIHDDLPAMDNDDLRRGQPTSHKVFGEATAILTGDALLTLSFEWIANSANFGLLKDRVLQAIPVFARAAGQAGMVGGQILDMAAENKSVTIEELKRIHRGKTGALLCSAIEVGGILSGASGRERDLLRSYGEQVGLLFQIVDDILDVEGDQTEIGKTPESDIRRGKATYPSLLGIPEAKRLARVARDESQNVIKQLPRGIPRLGELADYFLDRTT